MLNITAFIMTVCAPQRIEWLKESLDNLDSQNFPFVKKIVAADEFNGHKFPLDLKSELESRGWIVLIDNHKSRVKSADHVFSLIDSDYIFYNEEDVQAIMPKMEDLTTLFETKIDGRECGMCSLTLGGSLSHFPENQYGDLDKVKDNIILSTENYLIFRRLEEFKNSWFFEFPALIIKTSLFKECHRVAKKYFPNSQIEMGLTNAYFKALFNEKYYKCSVAKHDILNIVCDNPLKVFHDSRLIKCLDPQQGSSPHGGGHTF